MKILVTRVVKENTILIKLGNQCFSVIFYDKKKLTWKAYCPSVSSPNRIPTFNFHRCNSEKESYQLAREKITEFFGFINIEIDFHFVDSYYENNNT